MFMKIIDRYIAKEFIKFTLAALLVFTSLYVAVDVLSTMWQFNDVSSDILTSYYLYQVPLVVQKMIPVAALVATIFTISVLSRNSELVALFSTGMSLARITLPIMVLTAGIAVGSFFLSDKLIPAFSKKRNYLYYVYIKKNPGMYYTVKTDKIWYKSKDLIYNIKSLNPDKGVVQGLTLYYFDEKFHLMQMVKAKEARYEGKNWNLEKGTVTLFEENSSFPLTQSFDTKTITLDETPTDIQDLQNSADVMRAGELRRYIQKNKEAGLETASYEVSYHGKFSFAFTPFVMAFLGIPFSVANRRSGGFALNVIFVFGLVFTYWILLSTSMTMGSHGRFPPLMAAWAPNLIMMTFGLFALIKLRR